MTNSFCSLPWVGLDISPVGDFKPCCKYKNTIATTLNEYLNSAELATLKADFLAGQRPSGCSRCWADENAGLPSKRLLDQQYKFNNVTPSLDALKTISFPFGNTCNLACRICSSASSSKWRETESRMTLVAPIKIHKHQKFYKDNQFIKQIQDLAKDCMHFDFPGGEPFITGVDEQIKFLDTIIAASTPSNITLHYTTNCTTWPDERFWSRWSHFKEVDIQLSIDGIESSFEYQRWPANWNECYANIKRFQSVTYSNFKLSISHSVSIFNVMQVNNFIAWTEAEGLPSPYIGIVSRPEEFDIKNLPNTVKEKISLCVPVSVKQHMDTQTSYDFTKTIERIADVDMVRLQSSKTALKDLFDLLDIEHQKYYADLTKHT